MSEKDNEKDSEKVTKLPKVDPAKIQKYNKDPKGESRGKN